LYAALLLSPQQPIQISAEVDLIEVELGSEVVLTITVRAIGNEAVQIMDPPLNGLERRSSSERSDVSVEGGTFMRITTRDVRLAPTRTGSVTIGPVRVVQGEQWAETDTIELTVTGSAAVRSASLQPHIRDFIARHPPPQLSADEVSVEILTSTDRIVLGDQLDLIVLAWFPREIRARLRTPPTLQPPRLQGAWVYEQGAPGAAALSRQVAGVNYDVYAHHAVVFPLTPGDFVVNPATVSYSLPLTYSFLSREIRHEPQSETASVQVLSQPGAQRPPGFRGTAAADLEFTLDVMPTHLQVGSAGSVVATLAGRGNVSLWPEPAIEWPAGMRVYPENVEVEITPLDGYVAGVKRFHYLVVADSAGTHRIPAPRYDYFDIDASRYVSLVLEPVDLVTEGGRSYGAGRPLLDLGLSEEESRLRAERIVLGFPRAAWLLVILLPPVMFAALRVRRRGRRGRISSETLVEDGLEKVEREFARAVAILVPDADTRDGRSLEDALRAVGVEEPVAAHAVRVRDRLWQSSYGPEGRIDPDELVAEVEEVLRALTGERHPVQGDLAVAGLAVLLLVGGAVGSVHAQSAERLYQAGAYRAAADSFAARAEVEPWSATHHHNAGISLHRLGDVVGAKVEWVRAARLQPRSSQSRDLLEADQTADPMPDPLLWVARVTFAEAILLAAACWVVAWVVIGWRKKLGVVLLLVSVLSGAYGGWVHSRYTRPVALVVGHDTPLRWAPYGPSPSRRVLDQGLAVEVSRVDGRWALVELGTDRGWVLADEIQNLQ
jgi:hypothetical protein